MAIYPQHARPESSMSTQPTNIEAWTEQAAQSLSAVSLGFPNGVRGTSVQLAIDLDEHSEDHAHAEQRPSTFRPRREPLRRDSLKSREAILKGKEGSRRRTRWENDRLLNNPWAQPPLPSDFTVQPTHPKHNVPYYLAPLWDQEMAARAEAQKTAQRAARVQAQAQDEGQGKIPKELREKLKKAKAAKGLLRDLEEQVRVFVQNWEESVKKEDSLDPDSEDEEIVFVGRNGQMQDGRPPSRRRLNIKEELETDRLVFDSLVDDRGANFGRWLVHSIGSYYGLRTWSVTVGNPARREAYVGISSQEAERVPVLPRPLWVMV